jgi:hypothetical protein
MLALQVNSGTDAVAGVATNPSSLVIELQADHLRNEPLADRKQRLAKLLARGSNAITYNEHLEHDQYSTMLADWDSKESFRNA